MAKGLCCQVQADGRLGFPIEVTIHKKDGSTIQRCGVCEVAPSCSDPQKKVFRFRFLKNMVCGIMGGTACGPTPAGIAQYGAQRTAARTTGATFELEDIGALSGPGAVAPPKYAQLPIPGLGAPRRVTYTLP